jgi:hypothetical protein
MEDQQAHTNVIHITELSGYDYSNENLPRDFDIRIEVAEQREILEQV